LSLRDRRQKLKRGEDPYPHALPVFSVDTVEEGQAMFGPLCIQMYDGRQRWTPGMGGWVREDYESLDGVTDFMRGIYERTKQRERDRTAPERD